MSLIPVIIFSSIVSLVLALLHFSIWKTIVSIFALPINYQFILGIVLIVLALSFIGAQITTFAIDNYFSRIFYTISASWLGIATYLFLASIIYAIVFVSIRILGIESGNFLHIFGIVCISIALAVSIYGLINARNIVVKSQDIKLKNIPEVWKGKKIVWISDIHLGAVYGRSYAEKLVSKINEIKVDIVFIGGDLYDGSKVYDVVDIIKPFADLQSSLGTYFITGNHEEFRDKNFYLDAIKSIGIKVLNNEMANVLGLQIIGVDDRDSKNAVRFTEILNGLRIDKSKPVILLKHQPSELDIAEKAGVNLQISGHTHKAQMFPFNIFSYFLYKGYDYGYKDYGQMAVYTSSGVGTWGPPMRVGSNSEIVVINLI